MKRYIRSSSISDMSMEERMDLAKSSNDPEVLAKLADDENRYVRRAVAERTNDPALLAKVDADDACAENAWVRLQVAKSTDYPEILAKLADDEEWWIRIIVAERTDDPEILAKLADDEEWAIRKKVAERTDDPKILAKLADDMHTSVRRAVAERTDDPEILAKLDNADRNSLQETKKKPKWANIIKRLGNDYESGIRDPFYEQTEAADYILDLVGDVNSSLGYYVEPSVQAGQGGVWIYDENNDNEVLVDGYDFETFDNEISEIAFDSKSAADFKKKYKQYILSLVENE